LRSETKREPEHFKNGASLKLAWLNATTILATRLTRNEPQDKPRQSSARRGVIGEDAQNYSTNGISRQSCAWPAKVVRRSAWFSVRNLP